MSSPDFRSAIAQELPGKLQLPQSREEAEARLRVMEAFLKGAEDEAQGQPLEGL